jgi:hypothetical protein
MAQPYMNSRSPPPLQHPKPTHPAYPPPEPPKTPGGSTNSSPYSQAQRISSDGGYQRYSSPPVDAPQQQQQGFSAYAPQAAAQNQPQGYQQARPYGNMAGQGQGGDFGWQMNDATTQMGVQFGKSAVAAGQDYVEKNVSLQEALWANLPPVLPDSLHHLPYRAHSLTRSSPATSPSPSSRPRSQ